MNDDGTVNRGALPAVFNPKILTLWSLRSKSRINLAASYRLTMGLPAATEVLRRHSIAAQTMLFLLQTAGQERAIRGDKLYFVAVL
jgi:hypothetical protein